MTFPFLITIAEFNSEHPLDATCVLYLPDAFQDAFIDLPFFDALVATALAPGLPLAMRLKALRVVSRLPAVRRTISHDPQLCERFLTFCMSAAVRIIGGHFGELSDVCLDEVVDMIERVNRIYSIEDLCRHLEVANQFIDAVLGVVRGIFSKRYTIGSQRAERANDILLHFLTYAVKKNDQQICRAIVEVVSFYVDTFFGQASAAALLDEDVLGNSDLREIKGDISASYKLFEESYHYLEDVKVLINCRMAEAFFARYQSLAQSADFGLNHEKQQGFLSTMVNFIYTCVCSFLSFINVNAGDDFGFSSLVLQNFGANSNRETDVQKEGQVLGRIFDIIQDFEKLFQEEQLELMIDVAASHENSIFTHFKIAQLYLTEQVFMFTRSSVIQSEQWQSAQGGEALGCANPLIEAMLRSQSVFPGHIEGMLVHFAATCFRNISVKSPVVSKYAFKLLNTVLGIKNSLNRGCFAQLQLTRFISENLLASLGSMPLSQEGMEKREQLFEAMSLCYISDYLDDFIQNCHTIIAKILLDAEAAGDAAPQHVASGQPVGTHAVVPRHDRCVAVGLDARDPAGLHAHQVRTAE